MPHVFDHTPSAQEVFDEACRYFATSPGPSQGETIRDGAMHPDCVYRSPEGRVCVAGHFLPDAAYVPEMDDPERFTDGSDVKAMVNHYSDRIPAWWAQHKWLLKNLQSVHDDEQTWNGKSWRIPGLVDRLEEFAYDHKLDPKAIDQVRQRKSNEACQ
ncbi:hypothetical protein ACTG4Q_20825 [Bradyrhizobium denitrificans]